MTWRPYFGTGARPSWTRRGVEIDQQPLARRQMLPSPAARGILPEKEGSKSGLRLVEVRNELSRVAHRRVRSTVTGLEVNWKRQSPRRPDSRSSLQPKAGRRHSEQGTVKHESRMPGLGLTAFAVPDAGCHRQWLCDRRHRSACAEPSGPSGRPQLWGESRRPLSSFGGIIMVMSKVSQASIPSDHFLTHIYLNRETRGIREGADTAASGERWEARRRRCV